MGVRVIVGVSGLYKMKFVELACARAYYIWQILCSGWVSRWFMVFLLLLADSISPQSIMGRTSIEERNWNSEIYSIPIYNVHTKEGENVIFKRNGRYVRAGLSRLNYLLRDWRTNEQTNMNPRLFDLLWQLYQQSGSKSVIHIVSSYRSPQTNRMLRLSSPKSGVAENSQHILGNALDFYIPDVHVGVLRKLALRMQGGGVGYYPHSRSPFVHIDAGNIRYWPRMNRDELLALFPDGKTAYLPADGRPLMVADRKKNSVQKNSVQKNSLPNIGQREIDFASIHQGMQESSSITIWPLVKPFSEPEEMSSFSNIPVPIPLPIPVAIPVSGDAPASEILEATAISHNTSDTLRRKEEETIPIPEFREFVNRQLPAREMIVAAFYASSQAKKDEVAAIIIKEKPSLLTISHARLQ